MNALFKLLAFMVLILVNRAIASDTIPDKIILVENGNMPCTEECATPNIKHQSKNLFKQIKYKIRNNERLTAAILAFPVPFGFFGGHRIYLGSKPYMPLIYIATLGGGFGILPLIDFAVILFDKDFDKYKQNSKVFMWNGNENR